VVDRRPAMVMSVQTQGMMEADQHSGTVTIATTRRTTTADRHRVADTIALARGITTTNPPHVMQRNSNSTVTVLTGLPLGTEGPAGTLPAPRDLPGPGGTTSWRHQQEPSVARAATSPATRKRTAASSTTTSYDVTADTNSNRSTSPNAHLPMHIDSWNTSRVTGPLQPFGSQVIGRIFRTPSRRSDVSLTKNAARQETPRDDPTDGNRWMTQLCLHRKVNHSTVVALHQL